RKLDEPEKYRDGEYSGWAPTYVDYNYGDSRPFHVPERFGHALLEVGRQEVTPPAKVFELIFKSDFNSGETRAFANGILRDECFRGPGKSLSSKAEGSPTLYLKHPLENLEDATLIMTFKLHTNGVLNYYGRTPDGWKCGACRHEMFLTQEAIEGRKRQLASEGHGLFPMFDLYDTHADKPAWKPWGRLWKGPGPWALVTGYFSEPSPSYANYPGTDWVILRTRLGVFRRDPGRSPVWPDITGQSLVPATQGYPDGLVFYASKRMSISDLVIFRGTDIEPPEKVKGV